MTDERVKVLIGDNDDQWEVRFSREVHRETGVSPFLIAAVSVEVDPETGNVSRTGGYRAGSFEDMAEQKLFDSCKDDIVEGLALRGVVARMPMESSLRLQ